MTLDALADLGVSNPVLAAPMSGGPGGPALVSAASSTRSMGFLAGGYKTPEVLAAQIDDVRSKGIEFGVNLFVPNPVPVDRDEFRGYARLIEREAALYGIDVDEIDLLEDDDHWQSKIDLLVDSPVPVVSFTFGIPDRPVLDRLRRAGSTLVQTVTSVEEARLAAASGVDMLVVQGAQAGGHRGTLTPDRAVGPGRPPTLPQLVMGVRDAVQLPLFATGGIATPADVTAALQAGARAVMVGTLLLRSDESEASSPHKAALAEAGRGPTVVTRAFTGRPARGLPNLFTQRYSAGAPSGYPAIHHLTSPIRRAATAAGDKERISLWAGAGYLSSRPGPAAAVLEELAGRV